MKRTSLFFARTSEFWQSLEKEIARGNMTIPEAGAIFWKVEKHFMASLKMKWRLLSKNRRAVADGQ